MDDGDVVVFMNFRADRARQITRALTDPAFAGFTRRRVPKLARYVCLTSYGDEFARLPVAFPPQSVANSFGEYIAGLGLTQLRIAETEKYAHVTYFFSGGVEAVYPGEDRILIPSPKVATYDLKPEMSAVVVTDKLVAADRQRQIRRDRLQLRERRHGRSYREPRGGDPRDRDARRLHRPRRRSGREAGGEVLITADHGNAEQMHDDTTGQPHTAHTLNLVPCVYVGRKATIAATGGLQDIAPTLLAMMALPPPHEMTGRSLLTFPARKHRRRSSRLRRRVPRPTCGPRPVRWGVRRELTVLLDAQVICSRREAARERKPDLPVPSVRKEASEPAASGRTAGTSGFPVFVMRPVARSTARGCCGAVRLQATTPGKPGVYFEIRIKGGGLPAPHFRRAKEGRRWATGKRQD